METDIWQSCRSIERNPEKVSGAWVFKDTRVLVRSLFENLKDGATVDEYLEWFPGVTQQQVKAILDCATGSLATPTEL